MAQTVVVLLFCPAFETECHDDVCFLLVDFIPKGKS